MAEELSDEMIKQKQTEALLAAMNNPLVRARLSPAGFASYASNNMWHLAPHLSILNRKLLDVSSGRIKRLMIFMPPRSGKCVDRYTQILLADGRTINAEDVKVGDVVVSIDSSLKICTDSVVSVECTGEHELLKIETECGFDISVTNEHRLLTFDGWKEAGDITTDDYICVPRVLPEISQPAMNMDDVFLIALWLAEGSKTVPSFEFTNGMPEIINEVNRIARERGWIVVDHANGFAHRIKAQEFVKNANTIDTPHGFLRYYGLRGMTTETLRIPPCIMTANNNVLAKFINILFACDGNVGTTHGGFEYSAKSRAFLDDLRILLLRFGIRSSIHPQTTKLNGKKFHSFVLCIAESESGLIFADRIGITGKAEGVNTVSNILSEKTANGRMDRIPGGWQKYLKSSTYRLWKDFRLSTNGRTGGISRDKATKIAIADENDVIKTLSKSDVVWLKVKKIIPAGKEITYDIETTIYHNFFANGICSHNSELISKYYPCWYLGTHPEHRVIMAGHTNDFAMQWGRKARDIMEAYGKEVFGVEVSQTSSAADRWDIQGHVGGMDTAGVGGSLTGKGADLLVADDIVKGRDVASSSVKLENIFEWFTTDAYTRLMPGGRVVIVLTRWSMADPAGRLLSLMEDRERELADKGLKLPADERWEVLKFPAIAEEDEYYTEYNGEKKMFRKKGDVLWPQMFSLADMEDRRRTLGAYWFAAMYQQRPVPREGAVFNKDWFRYFTFSPDGQMAILHQPDMPTPKVVPVNKCRRLMFVDTAGKTKSTNDYTAALATLFTPEKELLIFDGMNERLELPDQIKRLTDMYYKTHPSTIFVEDISYGTALIQTAKRTANLPIRPLEMEWTRRNKEDKAAAIVSRYQTGMVYHLRTEALWKQEMEQELLDFPAGGEHDDLVDCCSYAGLELLRRREPQIRRL